MLLRSVANLNMILIFISNVPTRKLIPERPFTKDSEHFPDRYRVLKQDSKETIYLYMNIFRISCHALTYCKVLLTPKDSCKFGGCFSQKTGKTTECTRELYTA